MNANVVDPLAYSHELQQIRAEDFLVQNALPPTNRSAGCDPYIQHFIFYKHVCNEILEADLHFRSEDAGTIDWLAFACTPSDDMYVRHVQMRSRLATIALARSEGP